MNLRLIAIKDSIADYKNLTSKFGKDNFYFVLAQKLANYLTTNYSKQGIFLPEINVLGNKFSFSYKDGVITLKQGNDIGVTGKGPAISALENAIYNLYQQELKRNIKINRPKGRTLLSDRSEFGDAKGTCFTKLYKSVAYDEEGRKNQEVLGSRSSAAVLTEQSYNNAIRYSKSFNKDRFKKVEVGGIPLYLNKGSFVKTIPVDKVYNYQGKVEDVSVSQFGKILQTNAWSYGYWARTPELSKAIDLLDEGYSVLLTYKSSAWLLELGKVVLSVYRIV